MADIEVYTGEAKTVTITYAGSLDVSGASLSFAMKSTRSAASTIASKSHSDFNTANAATGTVTFVLTTTDLATAGDYIGQVKTAFSATNIDKSPYITIRVEEAIV